MSEDVYTRPYPTTNIYDSLRVTHPDPVPGTQQNAVQKNSAQPTDSGEPKKNGYRAAAVCLGLLCFLLLAVIIGLVIHNHNLVKHLDLLQTSLDELQTRYINQTEEQDDPKKRLCELPGWKTFGTSCYYISTEKKNWEESRQYCKDNQSDLMVIKSKETQDFVDRFGQRVWLGLTDREEEDSFKWVDGTPLNTPTYWIRGDPNNNGKPPNKEEDCVEFTNEFAKPYRGWNDRSCVERNHWICERVIY